jgi:ATP-binding cassette, subfamily C, bacterial CydCD
VTEFVRLMRIARPVWGRLALAVLLGTCAALAAIGLMATSGYLISRASQQPPILTLTTVIVMVRFFGISRGVFRYLERLVGHDAALRVLADLRVDVYRGLVAQAPAGLSRFRSGDLLSRLVSDVDELQELYLRVVPPFGIATVVAVLLVIAEALLVPAAAVVTAVGFTAAIVGVPWVTAVVNRRSEQQLTATRGELGASVVELLQTIPERVVAGTQDEGRVAVGRVDHQLRDNERHLAWGAGLGAGLGLAVEGITVVLCLVFGAAAVDADALSGVWLAVVVLTPLAAFELAAPLPTAAGHAARVHAAAQRVFGVVDATPPVNEPSVPRTASAPFTLALDGVSAAWPGQSGPAISAVDLRLRPGTRTALVGPSGSGKSTVAAVALRFLDPVAGTASLGGVDLRDLGGDQVRTLVGLLGQDAHLFDTTVKENVLLANRDADEDDLRRVLADARLLDWVDALPQGWDTRVGEHGAQLSGGQRQRLALARVLLRDFPIVILDEPTEHLDLETADTVMADLLRATSGRTTLVISHRLAGLTDVDEIVVLTEGQVVQRGTHAELLAADGWYASSWSQEIAAAALLARTTGQA